MFVHNSVKNAGAEVTPIIEVASYGSFDFFRGWPVRGASESSSLPVFEPGNVCKQGR